MVITAGSKVFVRRGIDRKVLVILISPFDRALKSSSEILSYLSDSEYDIHSIISDCQIRLRNNTMPL